MEKKTIIYLIVGVIIIILAYGIAMVIKVASRVNRSEINLQGVLLIERSLESYLSSHDNQWPTDWSFLDPNNERGAWDNNYIRSNYKLRGISLDDHSDAVILYPSPIFLNDRSIEHIEQMYRQSERCKDNKGTE